MSAYDELLEAAADLVVKHDPLAIAQMYVLAQAELANLKAPITSYYTADGRYYHPDDITIIRSPR